MLLARADGVIEKRCRLLHWLRLPGFCSCWSQARNDPNQPRGVIGGAAGIPVGTLDGRWTAALDPERSLVEPLTSA